MLRFEWCEVINGSTPLCMSLLTLPVYLSLAKCIKQTLFPSIFQAHIKSCYDIKKMNWLLLIVHMYCFLKKRHLVALLKGTDRPFLKTKLCRIHEVQEYQYQYKKDLCQKRLKCLTSFFLLSFFIFEVLAATMGSNYFWFCFTYFSLFFTNICHMSIFHGRGFLQKQRPVNSVNYLILMRV